jgi:hypothetical protein
VIFKTFLPFFKTIYDHTAQHVQNIDNNIDTDPSDRCYDFKKYFCEKLFKNSYFVKEYSISYKNNSSFKYFFSPKIGQNRRKS